MANGPWSTSVATVRKQVLYGRDLLPSAQWGPSVSPVVQARREEDLLDGDLSAGELLVNAPPYTAHTAVADAFEQLVPPGDEFGVLLGHARTVGPGQPVG